MDGEYDPLILTEREQKHIYGENAKGGNKGVLLRQIILGGQDGLVNVLGLVLGVASATKDSQIIIVAGIAATFAESLSMAAVAYTSSRAEEDHYHAELAREKREVKEVPEIERKEVELIYYKKGFRGKALSDVVKHITSDEKIWVDVMMNEELGFGDVKDINPRREGLVVGISSFAGSLIPLVPFVLIGDVQLAMLMAAGISLLTLFAAGAIKAKITIGNWFKSGLEMLMIGGLAGIAGYAVGALLGVKN
ncbi:VIT family protein [Candidatus Anstonella stagnisolia]|nr:VIT family protein [Candidatus Anstonella stagnisolia]